MINLILASTEDGGIGFNNVLPWHYSDDFKVFKALTINKKIIMGKSTWESLPKKPLPKRTNIVLTGATRLSLLAGEQFEDTFVSNSFINTLKLLRRLRLQEERTSNENKHNVNWVIGGASIYRQFIPVCSYVQHTLIRKDYECDTFFNPLKKMDLELVSEVDTGTHSDIVFRLYYRRDSGFKKNQEFEEETTGLIRSTLGIP